MVCLDIGPDLIEVAKKKLKTYPNVSFRLSTFEEWSADQAFDLLISATAFHWVNPKVKFIKARDMSHLFVWKPF